MASAWTYEQFVWLHAMRMSELHDAPLAGRRSIPSEKSDSANAKGTTVRLSNITSILSWTARANSIRTVKFRGVAACLETRYVVDPLAGHQKHIEDHKRNEKT